MDTITTTINGQQVAVVTRDLRHYHQRLNLLMGLEGLTYAKLAEDSESSLSLIGAILAGNQPPSPRFQEALAKAYPDWNHAWMLEGEVPGRRGGRQPGAGRKV